jgi:hypothetical protein
MERAAETTSFRELIALIWRPTAPRARILGFWTWLARLGREHSAVRPPQDRPVSIFLCIGPSGGV